MLCFGSYVILQLACSVSMRIARVQQQFLRIVKGQWHKTQAQHV